jgi:adenylate kinase
MKVIVAAVPGAGKTTTLEYVKKILPEAKIVNVGDLILEIASEKFGIKDRDELRKKLNLAQQRELQLQAYKKIASMKEKYVFIDTHIAIKTVYGFFPGVSRQTAEIVKPEVIILLEYLPETIIERRIKDVSRKREIESEREIEEHQEINREFAIAVASHVQAAVEIVNLRYKEKEPFEHAKKGAEEIVKIVRKLSA